MKSQVLHTVWCNITGEAAGEIWTWSLLGVKGLIVFCYHLARERSVIPALHVPHLPDLFFLSFGSETAKSGKGEKGEAEAKPKTAEEEKPALPSAYDEDLKLRAAMYGVLFQAYADKVAGALPPLVLSVPCRCCCWRSSGFQRCKTVV